MEISVAGGKVFLRKFKEVYDESFENMLDEIEKIGINRVDITGSEKGILYLPTYDPDDRDITIIIAEKFLEKNIISATFKLMHNYLKNFNSTLVEHIFKYIIDRHRNEMIELLREMRASSQYTEYIAKIVFSMILYLRRSCVRSLSLTEDIIDVLRQPILEGFEANEFKYTKEGARLFALSDNIWRISVKEELFDEFKDLHRCADKLKDFYITLLNVIKTNNLTMADKAADKFTELVKCIFRIKSLQSTYI